MYNCMMSVPPGVFDYLQGTTSQVMAYPPGQSLLQQTWPGLGSHVAPMTRPATAKALVILPSSSLLQTTLVLAALTGCPGPGSCLALGHPCSADHLGDPQPPAADPCLWIPAAGPCHLGPASVSPLTPTRPGIYLSTLPRSITMDLMSGG
eukprot:jgi/Mesvir1/26086/Mv26360-RA.1